jgi:hypothetical protein
VALGPARLGSQTSSVPPHREELVDFASGLRIAIDDGTRKLNAKFTNSGPATFSPCSSNPESRAEFRLPFFRTGSELASRAGQKPIIVSPNSKEILLVSKKAIPLRAKTKPACVKFSGSPASNSLAKPQRQVLEWTAAAGDYEITALDDHDRAGSHSVVVR